MGIMAALNEIAAACIDYRGNRTAAGAQRISDALLKSAEIKGSRGADDRRRAALWADVARRKQAGHILPELALWLLAMALLLCLCAVLGSMAQCQQTAMDCNDPLPGPAMGADPPRDSRLVVSGRWLSNEVQP